MENYKGEGAEFAYLMDRPNSLGNAPEIVVSTEDRQLLRELGSRVAEIASLPEQAERKRLWTKLNKLEAEKPMVWLNDICWSEINVNDELTLQTRSEFCKSIERELRQRLYWWNHMRGDMVVEPLIYAPMVVDDTGIGINVEEDILATEETNEVVSHGYHEVIQSEDDLDKIQMPRIKHYVEKSRANLDAYREIFDGVLEVSQRGFLGFNFSPWDHLVRLTGVQQALLDLVLRPELMHGIMQRLTDAAKVAIDQLEELNIFSLNNRNVRVGSGAYGYTDEMPSRDHDGEHVRAKDIWVFVAAQIFAEVSPEMHEEFALHYERQILERFRLSYYGCCEPLFRKMHLMRTIPNLRKVSASPWNDLPSLAEQIGKDYVFSLKPNPEILARDTWDSAQVRADLKETLRGIMRHGCHVEMIMKDISTVRHEPERLWDWTQIATELAEEFAEHGTAV